MGSKDQTLRLWEVSRGRCVRTFEGHKDDVRSVCLSSDGRWALSGSDDTTLRLWDVSSGRCLRTFEGHTDDVNSVCLSSDGRWALSGSGGYKGRDNTLRLWELDWEFEAHDPADWDEAARPCLVNFLTLHTPPAGQLPNDRTPTEEELQAALSRCGRPAWTEAEFQGLVHTLACAGYGWLRPEGVKRELGKMAADWKGPPPLPGEK